VISCLHLLQAIAGSFGGQCSSGGKGVQVFSTSDEAVTVLNGLKCNGSSTKTNAARSQHSVARKERTVGHPFYDSSYSIHPYFMSLLCLHHTFACKSRCGPYTAAPMTHNKSSDLRRSCTRGHRLTLMARCAATWVPNAMGEICLQTLELKALWQLQQAAVVMDGCPCLPQYFSGPTYCSPVVLQRQAVSCPACFGS